MKKLETADVMRHIRVMFPEFSKTKEKDFLPLLEIALKEVCQEGYGEHNYLKAISLYTLHLMTDIKQRGDECWDDYRQDVLQEKDNDVSTTFSKVEKINGIKPTNKYHFLFLQVPSCKIKSSFGIPIQTGCGGGTGAWSGTDRVPYVRNTRDK